MVDHARGCGKTFFAIRMLTHNLFAVANILVKIEVSVVVRVSVSYKCIV